ncbi:cytochrome b/b6 domain-containing protein [Exilibacterium tricleocarpae]|uniref:Cytochrome b/b6 domain-containing protein n=1 Tax=Exilibacterium tricleocarpae TaxID=2591008 RepID=A0A545TVC0_9GAMM|nr:cytochrome b/b6 domain-containing protein [Exilibacterium tricleocarpae]TQV81162.1 cytochrome b/b6 domain-containing protein [Exilibacterium tricleocarpae]
MADKAITGEVVKTYAVWDRNIRWFHWINVICVLLLAILGTLILNTEILGVSGGGKILLKELHTYTGYVFFLNLLWRFTWAFVGGRYARWRAILPGGRGYGKALADYIKGLRRGEPPAYLGHNPLGRLMVGMLLLLLLVQGLTGLVLAGTDLYKPPFGSFIATWVTGGEAENLAGLRPGSKAFVDPLAYEEMRRYRKPVVTVHLYCFYTLMVLIVLHITGVVTAEVRERSNLVSALFSGRKTLTKPPLDG